MKGIFKFYNGRVMEYIISGIGADETGGISAGGYSR